MLLDMVCGSATTLDMFLEVPRCVYGEEWDVMSRSVFKLVGPKI